MKLKIKKSDGISYGDYTGTIKNGAAHGIGRFISEFGQIFEGQFKDGAVHGYLQWV